MSHPFPSHHIDVDVKASERPHDLLVTLHHDPDLGANASVDQLAGEQVRGVVLERPALGMNHGVVRRS